MKHIIILGDGMADHPLPQLGGRTLLQAAHTPWMDLLARQGRNGRLVTVAPGFHPGSEVANMSVLGYDLPTVYEGRGPLEAASIGVDLAPGDMAMRCNLVCLEGDLLKNHSAGHITTEEADTLIRFLQERLGDERVHFYTGVQYRHLLVIRGGDKRLDCTPPHDVPLQPWRPLLPKAECPEAQQTADLLDTLILRSQDLLRDHPLNKQRIAQGKDPANSIWPWSPGYRPQMEPFSARFPQVRSGAVITAVDLIRGIGRYAGLRRIDVPGATGLYDTNYEGKVRAALDALRTDDFVYLHIEASDEAGHEGDIALKRQTIEDLDSRVVGPIYEAVKDWPEPVAIAVLPDHPTPCEVRTHTAEPVPFLVWHPGIEPDAVQTFDEVAACEGSYGLLKEDQFINTFMNA
ncbi:cofactor-independent phosphoglycerate mutase [Bacteroides sp. ET71]|uniref:cofactor-independent phosphoglycerate mutase n=1 Tax=Bacteroides sp. ET71 TaxID=2939421 RepID=UPI0020117DE4|nr:cofactor-independent phosphoglycerate mutase [Bacteroides sp. ET71]MCL1616801.1 cofactor-independent phosphoglycerate mutase [Bacteroides sp. ET71]